jgi:hypothetical protein
MEAAQLLLVEHVHAGNIINETEALRSKRGATAMRRRGIHPPAMTKRAIFAIHADMHEHTQLSPFQTLHRGVAIKGEMATSTRLARTTTSHTSACVVPENEMDAPTRHRLIFDAAAARGVACSFLRCIRWCVLWAFPVDLSALFALPELGH